MEVPPIAVVYREAGIGNCIGRSDNRRVDAGMHSRY